MKLTELFDKKKPTLSFEIFPPKNTESYEIVRHSIEKIALLKPDYMSVTYGAGGGTSDFTSKIATGIQEKYNVSALAHLTCISSNNKMVKKQLEILKAGGVKNILALRGDIPKDTLSDFKSEYTYASDLIKEIKGMGDFCIGGACYPEGHIESPSQKEDILHLKEKVDLGCDFLTTQMFFDNNILYNFLFKIRDAGIKVPVVAGIMPVTSKNQIKRITSLSGTILPRRFVSIIDRFGDDDNAMTEAGIAYATEQIIDLYANGVFAVHVYSMNKPYVAEKIQDNLSYILGRK